MSRRPATGVVDYLLIGLNPALIMTLLGSLVFFLLDVFYQGDFAGRLQFTFAMFVMATVCIARISIEAGRSHATFFALPLGILTVVAVNQFTNLSLAFNVGLLALVWWSADRLTWDCTVIDEEKDASGAGLLQVLGWERHLELSTSSNAAGETAVDEISARGFRERWFPKRGDRRTPGIWVIYFSLAALPLFGIGQWCIPVANVQTRSSALLLLMVYMASALSLLMTTTFLGLRRYLRQRGTEMPIEMTGVWLLSGGLMIAGLLAAALLLPHPSRELTLSPATAVSSPIREASKLGTGREGVQEKQADQRSSEPQKKSSAENSGEQKKSEQQSSSNQKNELGSEQAKQPSSADPQNAQGQNSNDSSGKGDQQSGSSQTKSESAEKSEPRSEHQRDPQASKANAPNEPPQPMPKSEPPQPQPPEPQPTQPENKSSTVAEKIQSSVSTITSLLSGLMQLLGYLVLFAILAFVGYKYRTELVATLRELLDAWRNFWSRLFGRASEKPTQLEPAPTPVGTATAAPFSSFANPFQTNQPKRFTIKELSIYSFQALEAWACENGCPREQEQTPLEFAATVAARHPTLGREARELAKNYSLAAYGGGSPPAESLGSIRSLWKSMMQ